MFVVVKEAHLNGELEPGEYAYVVMPGNPAGPWCLLNKWLHSMTRCWRLGEGLRPAVGQAGFGGWRTLCSRVPQPSVGSVVRRPQRRFRDGMEQEYSMTVRATLEDEPGDDRDTVTLNRLLKWREDRLEYEADPLPTCVQGHGTFDGVERSGGTRDQRNA